ncbi:hypothetical protein [Tsukamurella pseudospumae]|uniref:hypothetical protein n=1 Tax=Tsukamurella pseudospumae TaxID=239498 RepID=UPI001586EDAE|nr:hypothetical protein [Tsukamurella pseudospumae]
MDHPRPRPGTVGFGIPVDEQVPLRVMRTRADVLGGTVALDPDGNHVTMLIAGK